MKNIPVLLFTLYVSLSFSQTWKWNPIQKIDNSFHQHFIGTEGSNSYLLTSKFSIKNDFKVSGYNNPVSWSRENKINLIKFNEKFAIISNTPFSFNKRADIFYDAFISDKNIFFLYAGIDNHKYFLFADKYDPEGKFIETIILTEYAREINLNDLGKYFFLKRSADSKYVIVNAGRKIKLLNSRLKEVWTSDFNYKYLTDLHVSNTGEAFAMGGTDTGISLIKYDLKGSPTEKKINAAEKLVQDFNLRVDEKKQMAFVIYNYGTDNKNREIYFGLATFQDSYESRGLVIHTFNSDNLSETAIAKIPYSDEVLLAMTGKKKIEKIKGIEYLFFNDLYVTDDNKLLIIMQKSYTQKVTRQSGSVIEKSYSGHYEDIFLVNTDIKGQSSIQKIIKRNTEGASQYEYLLSLASFYQKNKLYILFNEGMSSYTLKQYEISSSLDTSEPKEFETYKEHKIYLAIRNYFKLSENKYIFWGRENKNVGSAILTFD